MIFFSYNIFWRNIYFGDVSHKLVLTVACSIIKWETPIVGNYLFFCANKLAKLGGDGRERETLEWIAKCQILQFVLPHLAIINIEHGNKQFSSWSGFWPYFRLCLRKRTFVLFKLENTYAKQKYQTVTELFRSLHFKEN